MHDALSQAAYCPDCGADARGIRFRTACGSALAATLLVPAVSEPVEGGRRSGRTAWVIGVASLAVALAIGGVFALLIAQRGETVAVTAEEAAKSDDGQSADGPAVTTFYPGLAPDHIALGDHGFMRRAP